MNPRYELQGELGQGGAGTVYKAFDKRLQRFVAIKVLLPPDQRGQGQSPDDLIAEAAALSVLQHPNVVSVFDVEPDEELGAYVVMEYLNGENLEQIVQKGPLEVVDFYEVALQTMTGVNAAHKLGVQHRDIKPGNVMINWLPDGTFQVKVLDFGLARFTARPSRQTSRSSGTEILGSVHFMAPEQFSNRPLDQRSDIYSLGCLFYYALTSRRPFDGPSLTDVIARHQEGKYAPMLQVRPQLPPLLCEWVQWLMKKYPEERPRTIDHALEVLTGIRSGALTELPAGLRTARITPASAQAVKPEAEIVVAAMGPCGARTPAISPAPAAPAPASAARTPGPPGGPQTGPARRPGAGPVQPAMPRRPGPPPGKPPAAARHAQKRSPLPLVITLIAAAAAATGAVIYFNRDKPDDKKSPPRADQPASVTGKDTSPQTPQKGRDPLLSSTGSAVPGDSLTIWCRADKDVFGPDGTTPAGEGGTVFLWSDQADQRGRNSPQYIGSTSQQKEKRVPLLRTVTDGTVPGGRVKALSFDGERNLVVRDRDKVGDPLTDCFDKDGVSVGLTFRVTDDGPDQRLISADSGKHGSWEMWLEKGVLYAGGHDGKYRTEGVPVPAGRFVSAVATFDFDTGVCSLIVATPDGVKSTADAPLPKPEAFEMLRIGASDRGFERGEIGFKGEFTELLVYRHPLKPLEANAAAAYLYRHLYESLPPGVR